MIDAVPDPLAAYVDGERLFGRHGAAALDDKCRRLFRRAPFAGGDALEIGAGSGLLSLWLLHHGARRVVSLEPESHGASSGALADARRHRQRLGLSSRWDLVSRRFQEFATKRRFRLALSHASVNHLDEEACVRLHEDDAARATYRGLFTRLRDLLEPGGSAVLVDVGRKNLWPALGLASPWAPEIEWHKHQEPALWCQLLDEAGLTPIAVEWPLPMWHRAAALIKFR
jgi:hypothetical protein